MDYHVHPYYSMDAEPYSLDSYCERALVMGLQELCFTTHFECDPERRNIDWLVRFHGQAYPMDNWSWIEFYLKDIERVREKYKPLRLSIKSGVEVGYDLGLERVIEVLIKNYPWDFVLGSVHCLNHIAISSDKESPQYFKGRTAQSVCKDYFAILSEAVSSKLFDCIGHLDIYKRYGLKYLGEELYNIELDYLSELLKSIAKHGLGIEINTSGQRKGLEFFPSRKILLLAKECGVKIFTVGSDAHRISELGMGVAEAVQLLNDQDLFIYSFDKRKPLPRNLLKSIK